MPRWTLTYRAVLDGGIAVALACLLAGAAACPALALSELKALPGAPPQSSDTARPPSREPAPNDPVRIPMPDPLVTTPRDDGIEILQDDDDVQESTEPDAAVEVLPDAAVLPDTVRRMREMIMTAAATGDIERLRMLLGKGMTQTQVSSGETEDDPVTTLKSLSGDPDGIEILAIMLDVLSSKAALVDKGTDSEIYIWPYFAVKPLASLTNPEKVDLFRVVTAGDFAAMEEFGSYNFYRLGITPDGQWKFFVAGD